MDVLLYILLVPLGILITAVFWIWVISQGVVKGMVLYEKWKKDNKEK